MSKTSRLRMERLSKGWTLEHVALIIRWNPGHLSKAERGLIRPPRRRIDALSKLYGVPVGELIPAPALAPMGTARE